MSWLMAARLASGMLPPALPRAARVARAAATRLDAPSAAELETLAAALEGTA